MKLPIFLFLLLAIALIGKAHDKNSESYLRADKKAKAQLETPGWWRFESQNFVILSNEKKRNLTFFMTETLEDARKRCSRYFTLLSSESIFGRIEFAADNRKYARGSGLWNCDRHELTIYANTIAAERAERNVMELLLRHEYAHSHVQYTSGVGIHATWFTEGIAVFFEAYEDRFSPEQHSKILKLLRSRPLSLQAIQSFDPVVFRSKGNMAYNYQISGLLFFYLLKAVPQQRKAEYKDIVRRYMEEIVISRDWRSATKKAWEGIDMVQFQRDFIEFIKDKRAVQRASRYTPSEPLSIAR